MKDMELDLDILENADDSEIKRIAEFNSVPDSAKERMFDISRKIYNEKTNTNARSNGIEVSGVEQYRKTVWQKFVAAAAALVLTAGAVSGGAWLIRNRKNVHTISTENETTLPTEENTATEATTENVTTLPTESVTVSETENEPHSFYDPITDSFIECDLSCFSFNLYNYKDDTHTDFNNRYPQWINLLNSFDYEELPSDYDIIDRMINYNGNTLNIAYTPYDESDDPYYIIIYENGIVSNSKDNNNIYYYQISEENAKKLIDMAETESKKMYDNLSPDLFLKLYTPVSADIICQNTDTHDEIRTLSNEDFDAFIKFLTASDQEYAPKELPSTDGAESDHILNSSPDFIFNIEIKEDNLKMYHIWFFNDNTIYCLYGGSATRRLYQASPEVYEAAKKMYDKYYTR
ncbi:MAG: hypothetical protein K6G33_09030 [Ruminococcus sp.]|uniref:hypothetical protein n=1 Tax=Ruminococcus sp. TaxID=41978 RepID=UPI0025F39159|nr:hypothetical protein [Ruminococcus sp.]MCR5600865.1 hypothetical protein [Ruminococcus sp.]